MCIRNDAWGPRSEGETVGEGAEEEEEQEGTSGTKGRN